MKKHAIFLSGPIGSGKSTFGRALADRLSGVFIDGDDYTELGRPWYCSILRKSRAIVRTGMSVLEDRSTVVVAYPVNCINWIYFRRKFGDAGVRPHFVSLKASYESIVAEGRGRLFSQAEHERIKVMIAEGYDARSFSDLVFETDKAGFAPTLDALESEVRQIIALGDT